MDQYQELLREKGLDFDVEILPLTVYSPKTKLYMDSPSFKGIVRTDNGHIYKACTHRQKIIQNGELIDILVRYFGYEKIKNAVFYLSDHNATKLSVMISNGYVFDGPMKLESFFTVTTSFDQTESFNLGITDVMVISDHMVTRREYKKDYSMKHTDSVRSMLDEFSTKVKSFDTVYDRHYEFYAELQKTKVNLNETYDFIKDMWGVHFGKRAKNQVNTRTWNRATQAKRAVRESMKLYGENMFGLYQGVLHFTNMDLVKGKKTRKKSLMYGRGYDLNVKAYRLLAGMIDYSFGR